MGGDTVGNPIRAPKDFWTGTIYAALGAVALWIGQGYKVGTAGRMGPGYFPLALASILLVLAGLSLVRSFVIKGEAVPTIAWRPMLLILLATGLFGLLLPRAGLAIALLALCLVSAAASKEFRFAWKATAGLIGLITFCTFVFVKGLGVPMPIIGRWLEPFVAVPWLH
ncbi:MAG: tripartite tricarboxylate transporter TctB family protein [Hyphomicrobiaceae bacterium]|nr:MAG: tripartite tricarboxylate transporter TctB family protein [Hyphomicrobiaceae bacterium]